MTNQYKLKKSYQLVLLSILATSFNAEAKPWLDTGDMKLRHELQLLSDSGLLNVPLTTWPLASKDIHDGLKKSASNASSHPELLSALSSINKRLEEEDFGSGFKVKAEGRTKKLLVRDFSGEGREKGLISYDAEWGNPVVDLRLKATIADKSNHPSDKALRFDESYISSTFDKWKITAGTQSRWWGPSWDGSLILSNNARPIPSLSIENVSSEAYGNKYLKWLGPNKLHFFIGQLESDRHVSKAKLIGTRVTFKPIDNLEVGLHRTIQWGGEGQDESFSGLLKTLISARLNKTLGQRGVGTVRGNQIAGVDARFNLPVKGNTKYSLYGQYIGEDRVEGSLLLGDETYLLGGSVSGVSSKLGGSWRVYLEATDTSAAWIKGRARNNIIYNHSQYRDGFRHLGVSMAHGIDSDSQIVSAGAMLSQKNGDFWRGWIKHAKLNIDGVGQNPIAPKGKKWSVVGVSLDRSLTKQSKLSLGLQLISEKEIGGSRDNNLGVSIGYSQSF